VSSKYDGVMVVDCAIPAYTASKRAPSQENIAPVQIADQHRETRLTMRSFG
jgi:hypothetical protein